MEQPIEEGTRPPAGARKGAIGVLIESHFDETEFRVFNEFFPANGYELEYLSHLWENESLVFLGNDGTARVRVCAEVKRKKPGDYRGILLIGGYATDRLRYEANPAAGRPNQAPAVCFLREAVAEMDRGSLKIGTICHSLWLLCADPALLKGRKVTCAHNIVCDVTNAGGQVVFDGDQTAELVVDGGLVTGKHPAVTEKFVERFLKEVENAEAFAPAHL